MNTMRYLCSLFGASTDDLVTAETPAGWCFWLVVVLLVLLILNYQGNFNLRIAHMFMYVDSLRQLKFHIYNFIFIKKIEN